MTLARGGRPPAWLGPTVLAAAVGVAACFASGALAGMALALAVGACGVLLAAFHFPVVLPLLLLLAAPFNYGVTVGGASIKLSEALAGAMLLVILLRAAAGDEALFIRLRRAALPLAALALLGAMAVISAAPRPNFFNVRYEIENIIACGFAILFFRRSWWPALLAGVAAALTLESAAALILKFGFGLTGTNFFNVGGIEVTQFSVEDLKGLAGGRFRLSGTLGHKNLLAAFYVLLLPVAALEALQRKQPLWAIALLPALATLALTDSMTGWGALALVTVLALLHLRRFGDLALLTLLVLPLAALGLYRFGDSIFLRVDQLFGSREGWGTVSSRFEIWQIALRLMREHPWLGIGRNNFPLYGETFYGHAHNLFAMKAIEMGIAAGLAFAGVIAALMARAWVAILWEASRLAAGHQYYRALGLWLGCFGFLVLNLFDYSYSHFSLGPLFLMFLGMLLAIALRLDERPAIPGGTI